MYRISQQYSFDIQTKIQNHNSKLALFYLKAQILKVSHPLQMKILLENTIVDFLGFKVF